VHLLSRIGPSITEILTFAPSPAGNCLCCSRGPPCRARRSVRCLRYRKGLRWVGAGDCLRSGKVQFGIGGRGGVCTAESGPRREASRGYRGGSAEGATAAAGDGCGRERWGLESWEVSFDCLKLHVVSFVSVYAQAFALAVALMFLLFFWLVGRKRGHLHLEHLV
jgi:hypothetical protein